MLSSRSWGGTPAGSPGGSRRGSDVGGEGLLGRVPQGRPMEELARMPAARRLGADEQGDGDGDEAGQEQTQMQGREITEALSATREVLVGAEAQLQGLKSGVEDAARALAGEVREMQALVQGLEGLGRKFEGDSQALEGEVRGLIERFAEFGAGAAGEQEAQEGERGGAGAAGGVQKLQIESIGKRLGAGKEKVLSLERRMLAVRQKTRDWEVQQVWRLQRRAERRRLIWSALLLALGVLVVLVGVWKPQRLLADGMGGIEDLKAAAGLLPSPDPASALAAGAEEGKITALSSRSRAVGGESLGAGLARVSGLTAMTGRQETGTCQGTGTGTGTGIGADVDADADADTRRFRAVIEGLDSL